MEIITKRLHIKRVILIVTMLLWMYLVFYLSNQNSTESNSTSSGIVNIVVNIYTRVMGKNISNNSLSALSYFIRKLAHFSLYFIGSIPVYILLKTYDINNVKRYMISILFCTIYASSDELHQLLLNQGRNGNIIDVVIDICGYICGMIFIQLVSYVVYKVKNRRNINECS